MNIRSVIEAISNLEVNTYSPTYNFNSFTSFSLGIWLTLLYETVLFLSFSVSFPPDCFANRSLAFSLRVMASSRWCSLRFSSDECSVRSFDSMTAVLFPLPVDLLIALVVNQLLKYLIKLIYYFPSTRCSSEGQNSDGRLKLARTHKKPFLLPFLEQDSARTEQD